MRVFIDTSAFIALTIASEAKHSQCLTKYQEYKQSNSLFYTNHLVLSELYTRLLYDAGKTACAKIIAKINDLRHEGKIKVFQLDSGIFAQAEKIMLQFAEHKLSFTDATICSMMKEYKLDEIFTLDTDFRKVGVPSSF